jgi:hypothetical protein
MGQAGTKWGKKLLIFGKILSHACGLKIRGNIPFHHNISNERSEEKPIPCARL